MERQPTYTNESIEHINATKLEDGADVSFHLGNPRNLSIEAARQAVVLAAEKKPEQEPVRPPHELSKGFSQGIIRLRIIKQNETLGHDGNARSWDNFEVTR